MALGVSDLKDDNANELLQDDVTIGDVAIGLYAQAILCYLLTNKIFCDESFCDALNESLNLQEKSC